MRQAGVVLQCFCSEFDVFLPFVQLPPVNADLPGREGPWGWASVSLDCRVGPWVPDCAPDSRGRVVPPPSPPALTLTSIQVLCRVAPGSH